MLIFATVAAVRLADEWGMSYAALIPYATPGFIAFGVGAIAAGWIADKWSREGMMAIFFIGIGASSIVTALADSPLEIALGLLAIGVFAAVLMLPRGAVISGYPTSQGYAARGRPPDLRSIRSRRRHRSRDRPGHRC